MTNQPKVFVRSYDDRGDPQPPNNWRPEVEMGDLILVSPYIGIGNAGCVSEEVAREEAKTMATNLGVQVEP